VLAAVHGELQSPRRVQNVRDIATPVGPQSLATALRTVTPVLHLKGAAAHVEFLKRALGAVEEMRAAEPSGALRYGRIRVGDAAIELGEGDPMPGSAPVLVLNAENAGRGWRTKVHTDLRTEEVTKYT
jgi:hypothetical protein